MNRPLSRRAAIVAAAVSGATILAVLGVVALSPSRSTPVTSMEGTTNSGDQISLDQTSLVIDGAVIPERQLREVARVLGSGETTEERRRSAIQRLVEFKAVERLAAENGLAAELDYPAFLRRWQAENERRRLAVAQGQVIYGPVQYSEFEYFQYLHSNLLIRLKDHFAKKVRMSPAQLRATYAAQRESFARDPVVTVQVMELAHSQAGDGTPPAVAEAQRRLAAGEEFERVASDVGATLTERTFDESSKRGDLRLQPALRTAALRLRAGEVSAVVEGPGALYLLRCRERTEGGYVPFDVASTAIRRSVADARFAELLRTRVQEAQVEVLPMT